MAYVEIERAGDDVVAKIHGEVDLSNARHIGKAIDEGFGNTARRSIVDLSHTEHLDSVGIQLLFALAESMQTRRRELRLVVPRQSRINRLLELVDMQRVIRVDADLEAALSS